MTLEPKASQCITALCRELASELDLHHEDHELPAAQATIQVLQQAAQLLQENGIQVPEVQLHIVNRYLAATRGGQH
ncbi:hypothetical protein RB623_06195 [Mesorhizobium sp. LHD-90]|uniref:hypothetical protein n=1 Tax=Mesorhizobium sp. LHD-90 TaxID=3071414 RepID=UPI0027DFF4CE|nr:hypothetical protein [Mesorhizobium sp. LHD-90]MDQ6433639.1 hypothetical protein [Mesorhizobium sp. LHD-90]